MYQIEQIINYIYTHAMSSLIHLKCYLIISKVVVFFLKLEVKYTFTEIRYKEWEEGTENVCYLEEILYLVI